MDKSHPLVFELKPAICNVCNVHQRFFVLGTTSFHKIFVIYAYSPILVGFLFSFHSIKITVLWSCEKKRNQKIFNVFRSSFKFI